MSFVKKFHIFNENYYPDGKKQKLCGIRYYYTPADLTPDMKRFLYGGLKLLASCGIVTKFDCEVFYLHEVEKKKQAEIAKSFNTTIDRVKKVTPKVRKILDLRIGMLRYIFFKDDFDEYKKFKKLSEQKDKTYIQADKILAKVCGRPFLEKMKEFEEELLYSDENYNDVAIYELYKEFSDKRSVVYEHLRDKKLGYTSKECKTRRLQKEKLKRKIDENYNILGGDEEVLFKLFGYILVFWLKYPKFWIE